MKHVYIILFLLVPLLAHASDEGGFGESMNMDFYTQIEKGNYTIQKKLLNTRLNEYKDMNDFISKCNLGIKLKPGLPISQVVGENGPSISGIPQAVDEKGVSTDTFAKLLKCINETYDSINKSTAKQTEDMRTLSSIGIYTDGSTENSDYDIISDIQKIDDIIFSEKIPYNGTKNIGKLSLFDLLANNVPLLGSTPTTPTNVTYANSFTGRSNSPNTLSGAPVSINLGENLAAGWCGGNTVAIPFSNPDPSLLQEINSVSQYGTPDIGSDGVGGLYGDRNIPATTPLSRSAAPVKGDFFHTPKCDSFFCIDIKMVPGTMNLLGGGKNFSIESLINKRYAEIKEISENDLTAKHMSSNFFENITKGLFQGSGLRTSIFEKSQTTRKLKKEERPQDVMDRLWRCAASTAGLGSTDWVQSNGFTAGALMNKPGADTATVDYRTIQQNPTDEDIVNTSKTCLQSEIALARKDYSDSFSTDLTEIQAFTHQIVSSIQSVIGLVDRIEKKPSEK